jgi:hypothetical protein
VVELAKQRQKKAIKYANLRLDHREYLQWHLREINEWFGIFCDFNANQSGNRIAQSRSEAIINMQMADDSLKTKVIIRTRPQQRWNGIRPEGTKITMNDKIAVIHSRPVFRRASTAIKIKQWFLRKELEHIWGMNCLITINYDHFCLPIFHCYADE